MQQEANKNYLKLLSYAHSALNMTKRGRGVVQKIKRQEKILEVIGKKGNPIQESFASSAMDCCRTEEHLNASRIQTNESDIL